MDALTLNTHRLVHLDLKGAPPKLSYFEKFFPLIKDMGATGILLEWEDTFPYTRELLPIGGLSNSAQVSGAPYSIEEARQLLEMAADCELSVIPLVQVFGHMEYVLKHEQWRSLREVEAYPSSMCPSNSETMALVRSLLRQIIGFHQNLQYIHIGADEVWYMGICSACSKRVTTGKYGKPGLYLDYITQVTQYIKENYPSLKIIMWDDMLRSVDTHILQEYYVGNMVEPMVWHYNSSETFHLGAPLWEKYSNIFSSIWIASAFKGATSSCQILPINKFHISNHEAWLAELGMHAGKMLHFKGIALTGWSRYDHYATLCELLPSSIPSLCLCMKTWLNGGYNQDLHNTVSKILGYNENTSANFGSPIKVPILPQLSFPGWQIFVGFEWFVNLRTKYKNIADSDHERTDMVIIYGEAGQNDIIQIVQHYVMMLLSLQFGEYYMCRDYIRFMCRKFRHCSQVITSTEMHSWFNQWQVLNNYTNPMQVDTILPVITDVLNELTSLETYLKTHLEPIFYCHTTEELIGTLIDPIKRHLKQVKSDCETQLSLGCRVRGQRRLNIN